jgi:hypothetical protein
MSDKDVMIAERMLEIDRKLKGNQFHDCWYSVNDVERLCRLSHASTRYWLEKGYKHGIFERRVANQGHGYYWWYEYKVF